MKQIIRIFLFGFFISAVFFYFFPRLSQSKTFVASTPTQQQLADAVLQASQKTSVRSTLLYALVGQETSYGRNLGKTESQWKSFCAAYPGIQDCQNWTRYDCKSTYTNGRFYDQMLQQLGFVDASGKTDRSQIPTSSTCALGFTQFEPNTWWLVMGQETDKIYNPWDIYDAVFAAALYLQELGADKNQVLSSGEVMSAPDRIALQRYYCGASYQRAECASYARGVEALAKNALSELATADLESRLDYLQKQKQILPYEIQPGELGVILRSPLDGQRLSSPVLFSADVGRQTVRHVLFRVDSERGIDSTFIDAAAPYEMAISTLPPGPHSVIGEVSSLEGKIARSKIHFFIVEDKAKPSPSAQAPSDVWRPLPLSAPRGTGTFPTPQESAEPMTTPLSPYIPYVPPVNEKQPEITITIGKLPKGITDVPYEEVTLSATGGVKPYQWQIHNGALPEGLMLDTTGRISGTPSRPQHAFVTFIVMDAKGLFTFYSTDIEIQTPLTIETGEMPAGTVRAPYEKTLTASGGFPPYQWGVDEGVLPDGLRFDQTTGRIEGFPLATGRHLVLFRVTDSGGIHAFKRLALEVRAPPLKVTTAQLPRGTVGAPYNNSVTAEGGVPPYTWKIISGVLPDGMALDEWGSFSGTPAAQGTFAITIRVTDQDSKTAEKGFSLSVDQAPAAP